MTERIDAHHHVWDLAARDQPWIAGEVMAPIRRNFGVDELTTAAAASGIAGTIVVQTVAEVAETVELLALATTTPLVVGVIGYVDVAADDVGDRLDQLLHQPAGSRLVGIRSLVQDEPDPAWLQRPAVLAGLREVAERELAFDLLLRSGQLDAATGAVTEVTEGRFVLDHLGKPGIASGGWEPWAARLAALAERPNVSAKLSGLVTEADWSAWSASDLRPYVDHALATFGPDRLMFGSDWPVCTLAAPYERVVAVIDELIDGLSGDEQAAIRGRTATSAYALADHARSAVIAVDEYQSLRLLVTGGASGIGHAVSTAAMARGAIVAVVDLDPTTAPKGAVAQRADVADDESVANAVEQLAAEMGGIDIVVNNAGIGAQGTVEANPLDEWRRVFDVNVFGMVRVVRAALPHLRRSTAAAIVNTCSIAATAGLPDRALYSATKGAVLSLTLAMAADHLHEGIRVNCVNPGTTDTPWIGRLLDRAVDPAAERAALEARQPSGRLVSPEQVAAAVLHLAGPSAGATTGTSLAVDGGMAGLRLRPP